MTTLREVVDGLPWGLHDAHLCRMEMDWTRQALVLELLLPMTRDQEMDQRARITLKGVQWFTAGTPGPANRDGDPAALPWIDGGEGPAKDAGPLPEVPEGCFLHHLYERERRQVFHVCARDAEPTWLESAPQPSRTDGRALFPGEEIPDPKR